MFESGAVPSQDGARRGSDGEGLAAAPHEDPQSQHQLDPALSLPLSLSLTPSQSNHSARTGLEVGGQQLN